MYEYVSDIPGEVWVPIACTDNRYEVSSLGRIKSLWRIKYKGKSYKPLILEPTLDDQGYQRLTIQTIQPDGSSVAKEFTVHRLVAMAFIPNPENKRTVNHKDGNKQNNCASNLEWMTQSENNKHAYLTGLNSNHIDYNSQKMPIECCETLEIWPSLSSAGRAITGTSAGLQYSVSHGTPYKGKHYRHISVDEYYSRLGESYAHSRSNNCI